MKRLVRARSVGARLVAATSVALTLLLTGCATTIQSDVTAFHQWPGETVEKSYVFEDAPAQDDTLELRSYQNLVRAELAKLGFRDASGGERAALKVSMRFTTTDVPVRYLMPAYAPSFGPRFAYASPFYRPYWGGRRHWGGGWYSARFYDPFWDFPPAYQEVIRHVYKREVQVAIKEAASGKRLFDVTVHNESRERSTPAVMPALVVSAFQGFPGPSGVARRVELKREG